MKQRISYLDGLRIFAILAVITIHVTAERWYKFEDTSYYLENYIFNFLSAWAIYIFIMISGALLLSARTVDLKKIYLKRIPHFLFILFIWNAIYLLYSTNTFHLSTILLNFRQFATANVYSHLWYLYMLIGLYILLPVIQMWISVANKQDMIYCLVVLYFTSIFSTTLTHFSQLQSLNNFFQSLYLPDLKYVFYFILGYFLYRFELSRAQRIGLYMTTVLILGVSIYSSIHETLVQHAPIHLYLDQVIFFVSSTIFVFAKYTTFPTSINRSFEKIGQFVFGIYLVHFMVEKTLLHHGIHSYMTHPFASVPAVVLLIFLVSLGISIVLSKIKYVNKLLA